MKGFFVAYFVVLGVGSLMLFLATLFVVGINMFSPLEQQRAHIRENGAKCSMVIFLAVSSMGAFLLSRSIFFFYLYVYWNQMTELTRITWILCYIILVLWYDILYMVVSTLGVMGGLATSE